MAGDERKSLDAGMTAHVTKPIDPAELFATLLKCIQPSEKRVPSRQPEVAAERPESEQRVPAEEELPDSLPGFDLAAGLERLRGNKRLYRKLLQDFGTKYKGVAGEIRETLDAKDLEQAHSLIHNLKGLSGNLAAMDLQAAAIEMEKLVKGEPEKASSSKDLNQKFSDLESALNQALASVQTLSVSSVEQIGKLSDEEISAIPAELAQNIAKRIRDAAEVGDVMAVTAIAGELKERSDSCAPLGERIVQLAEDFDFEGILKLASELTS
jgi:HPt (histidine-containing phosphotransfer) domain-containing protein